MAKTQEATTIDPLSAFGFGRPVLADGDKGALVVSKLNNYVAGFRVECHLSCAAGPDDWDGRDAPPALGIVAANTLDRPVATDLWINADEAGWYARFGMEWEMTPPTPGTNIEVTLTLTGGLGSLVWTRVIVAADSGFEVRNDTVDLSTVTAGGEWILLELEVQRTLGANAAFCKELNFEVTEGGLRDPENS